MKIHGILLSLAVLLISTVASALTEQQTEEENEHELISVLEKPKHYFVHVFKRLGELHGRIFVSHETQHGRLLPMNGNPDWLPNEKRKGFDADNIAWQLGLTGYFQPEDYEPGRDECRTGPISGLQEVCGICPTGEDPKPRFWCETVEQECCDEESNDCRVDCEADSSTASVASTTSNIRGSDGISTATTGEGSETTPASIPDCGNGITEEGEECDDGDKNGPDADCKEDCTSDFYVFSLRVNIKHSDVEFYLVRGSGESILNLDNLEATGELRDNLRREYNEGNVYGSGHPAITDENYQIYTLKKYLTPDDCYRFIFWDPISKENDGVEMELKIDGVGVYSMETYNVLKEEKHDSGGVKFGNCGTI